MEKKERRNVQFKRKRAAGKQNIRKTVEFSSAEQPPLRRLHISDDESNEEEFKQNSQTAPKFFHNSKTMPKFNQNPFTLNARQSLNENQMKSIPMLPLMNHPRQHIPPNLGLNSSHHQVRKIPPAPPPRQIFRTDPEGMQQSPATIESHQEKGVFQMAVVQQNNPPRIPPKPFVSFGHQQHHQRHLLNQTMLPNQFVFGRAQNMQNVNLNNSFIVNSNNINNNTNLHHQLQPKLQFTNSHPAIHHHTNQMFHRPKQLVHNNNGINNGGKQQMPPRMSGVMNDYVENRAEKSDPENHIYEMIDEYEVNSHIFQVPTHSTVAGVAADETKENTNLFQNLLRAEMMNQIQSCSKIGNNGYLSHLPQQKRMDIIQETAHSLATAAYLEKAAQRMVSAANGTKTSRSHGNGSERGGFCGSLQRAPPLMPPSLARRLSNKENLGFGRVKVMLRVSDNQPECLVEGEKNASYLTIDKKKRQVTLSEPTTAQTPQTSANAQDRGPMVSAPKMFDFDALHTSEDSQSDVCASALSEVIPAVLEGSDGCLLAIGYPGAGQNRTMLGSVASSNDLGAIPCAISWLYKGINEKRQKSGARFSVRVSALGINATKPGSSAKDLLAALATESDESPGMYLRDDFLGGPTELRAPTAERAALFLDAALAGRTSSIYEPALIFTLHVYQYSLAGKGGVAGGRSRLHLIDLGGCANRSGGLPLSGVGNVVLSILSGQRHPPNRDHPLTPLLKDCLAPLTCHVAIIAHVAHSQSHADSLTTIQLASRIHRLRRRKHRFPISGERNGGGGNAQSGSSSGPDPSSSDFSADTVIYVGPCADDATDNEHPPVFLPNLNSGDNRCAMNKVLKGSAVEKGLACKSPIKKAQQKTDSLKRNQPKTSTDVVTQNNVTDHTIYAQVVASNSPKIVAGALKHSATSKGSNFPTPKSSPMRRIPATTHESPKRVTEEKWIDGPRVSKFKVAEARHLMREMNHVKQCETWIDGPKTKSTAVAVPGAQGTSYGYMDNHKKTMIRQWVENQTCQIFQSTGTNTGTNTGTSTAGTNTVNAVQYHQFYKNQQKSDVAQPKNDDDRSSIGSKNDEFVNPLAAGLTNIPTANINFSESSIKTGLKQATNNEYDHDIQSEKSTSHISENRQSATGGGDLEEEDQDSGPSEVPPALPLIEPLGSREVSRHVSRESLCQNVMMMDCALQVTEDDIAKAMGGSEHPLSALSNGDISVVSSFNVGDTFSECVIGESARNQFDQLARLRELFTSQLAMAEVIPAFRIGDSGSVYSEPAFRFNAGPGSVCSEPVYRAPSPPSRCRDCRQSISRTPSQTSLPSLNGIVAIAGMEPYASLRHPDGASDPNIKKSLENSEAEEKIEIHIKENPLAELCETDFNDKKTPLLPQHQQQLHKPPHLPLLPVSTPEAYDSGHDSTPRASKHSGISRRAESGYHSVATVRDSDESSFSSSTSRPNPNPKETSQKSNNSKKKNRQDKSLCQWLRNPFTCTYPETEGDVSDF